jgi:hypothetical protein
MMHVVHMLLNVMQEVSRKQKAEVHQHLTARHVLQIAAAQMCNLARTVCGDVASLNSPSAVAVQVRNACKMSERFMVSVDNCTVPIIPVTQQSISLDPSGDTEVLLQVLPRYISPWPPTAESILFSRQLSDLLVDVVKPITVMLHGWRLRDHSRLQNLCLGRA